MCESEACGLALLEEGTLTWQVDPDGVFHSGLTRLHRQGINLPRGRAEAKKGVP